MCGFEIRTQVFQTSPSISPAGVKPLNKNKFHVNVSRNIAYLVYAYAHATQKPPLCADSAYVSASDGQQVSLFQETFFRTYPLQLSSPELVYHRGQRSKINPCTAPTAS